MSNNKSNNIYRKFKFKNYSSNSFEDLLPFNRADLPIKVDKMIKYAIDNKRARNIAITGNYSSGKSSILESFKTKHKWIMRRTAYVSLAKFGDDRKKNPTKSSLPVEQIIEKSIVEQIYFSNKNKVKHFNHIFILLKTIIISYFIHYFCGKLGFYNLLKEHEICRLFVWFPLFILVFIFIKFFYNINKLSISSKNYEFEVNFENDDNNIINDNYDVIKQIIEKARIRNIVFEDIDRYEKPIVFEHLKEMNKICSKVKFIYMIKDDIFTRNDRTKIFDIIIPIIPYSSYQTAGTLWHTLLKKYEIANMPVNSFINHNLIKGLSHYINDMRIIKNIMNEFFIYQDWLDVAINAEDLELLFRLMVYKNMFLGDFSLFQKNKGILNEFLHSKMNIEKFLKSKKIRGNKNYKIWINNKNLVRILFKIKNINKLKKNYKYYVFKKRETIEENLNYSNNMNQILLHSLDILDNNLKESEKNNNDKNRIDKKED